LCCKAENVFVGRYSVAVSYDDSRRIDPLAAKDRKLFGSDLPTSCMGVYKCASLIASSPGSSEHFLFSFGDEPLVSTNLSNKCSTNRRSLKSFSEVADHLLG